MNAKPMQAIWIEEGDDWDPWKLRANGVQAIYNDIRAEFDPVGKSERARLQGMRAGLYWGASWGERNYEGDGFAHYISDMIGTYEKAWTTARLGLQCEFQLDIETLNGIDHSEDDAWLRAFFTEWRKIRPLKVTSWTMESFQGGPYTWMSKELVSLINSDPNLVVVPQLYIGNMRPVDSAAALRNMTHLRCPDGTVTGIQEDRVQFFYDAANPLPVGWQGFLYTNRRLP
jgi:hypothetical protein